MFAARLAFCIVHNLESCDILIYIKKTQHKPNKNNTSKHRTRLKTGWQLSESNYQKETTRVVAWRASSRISKRDSSEWESVLIKCVMVDTNAGQTVNNYDRTVTVWLGSLNSQNLFKECILTKLEAIIYLGTGTVEDIGRIWGLEKTQNRCISDKIASQSTPRAWFLETKWSSFSHLNMKHSRGA